MAHFEFGPQLMWCDWSLDTSPAAHQRIVGSRLGTCCLSLNSSYVCLRFWRSKSLTELVSEPCEYFKYRRRQSKQAKARPHSEEPKHLRWSEPPDAARTLAAARLRSRPQRARSQTHLRRTKGDRNFYGHFSKPIHSLMASRAPVKMLLRMESWNKRTCKAVFVIQMVLCMRLIIC